MGDDVGASLIFSEQEIWLWEIALGQTREKNEPTELVLRLHAPHWACVMTSIVGPGLCSLLLAEMGLKSLKSGGFEPFHATFW